MFFVFLDNKVCGEGRNTSSLKTPASEAYSIGEYNKHFFFLIVGGSLACRVFEFTIQVMLSIAVDSASITGNMTPIASTMTIKAEFIGRTVLICFMTISVLKYSHANFAILIEMTEHKVDNSPLQKVFFKSV